MEGGDTLTIRQAAALLSVHPNTVRNRIKAGVYSADKVYTEHGETFLIPRSELVQEAPPNSIPSPSHSQPLPDVREAMHALLEPFVRELGDVREELGRERERREAAERLAEDLERELREAREALKASESPGPTDTPTGPAAGAHAATEPPQRATPRPAQHRPWWRRVFGG